MVIITEWLSLHLMRLMLKDGLSFRVLMVMMTHSTHNEDRLR